MESKTIHKVGIIMNGVTGRMGTNQHLLRSIVAIIQQGGVKLSDTEYILPDPILVGRNPAKLESLAASAGVKRWTTKLDEALADKHNTIYFDSQTTDRRADAVKKAIKAGKHIYCEKPTAVSTAAAYELYEFAKKAGVKNGVVQDKLWLPGMLKLKELRDNGFFGQILSVRGEFGYWVFEGDTVTPQRPSWNYRKEDGGGIIIDMLCHYRYVLDNLFGNVKAVSCLGATHVPKRWDEKGQPYKCTADDSAYATFELEGGVIAHFNSSWCVRVRRDDLLTLAGGRHERQRRGRVASLLDPAVRSDAASDVESRCRQPDQLLRWLATGAASPELRQRLQDSVGTFPPSRREGRTVPLDAARRRQGRAIGRERN